MKNFSQTTAMAIVLVITGPAAWFLLGPGAQAVRTARAESAGLRQEILDEHARLAAMSELFEQVRQLRERSADLSRRVPADHELGDFLRDLSVILERHELRRYTFQPRPVRAVDPSAAAGLTGLSVQPVLVQFEGRFLGLFSFVTELERLPRLSQVESLRVTADAKHPGRVRTELLINIYFLPRDPAGASAAPTAVRSTAS